MLATADTEDAADARHNVAYTPPERCKQRVHTPAQACHGVSSSTYIHQCTRTHATHIDKSVCVCACNFRWDIYMMVLPSGG